MARGRKTRIFLKNHGMALVLNVIYSLSNSKKNRGGERMCGEIKCVSIVRASAMHYLDGGCLCAWECMNDVHEFQ